MAIECSICYEIIGNENLEMVVTECGHLFHTICLNDWVTKSSTCPNCRVPTRRNCWRKLFLNDNRNNLMDSSLVHSVIEANDDLEKENLNLRKENQRVVGVMNRLQDELKFLRGRHIRFDFSMNQQQTEFNIMTSRNDNNKSTLVHKTTNFKYAHVESKVAAAWKN